MEEKETNAIRGPWCSSPVASLDHRWIYPYQQQSSQPHQLQHYSRKSRRNNRLANRRHYNNNNESPPDKKAMPMLLHPPPNLTSHTQHEPDSPQPLDFSVSGVSRYNGHVDSLRITNAGSGAGSGVVSNNGHRQDVDNSSDPEYATRTTSSGSSSASAISDEGSLVHSPESPDPNENRELNHIFVNFVIENE